VSTSCHGGAHTCVCTTVLVMQMIECTHEGGVAPLMRSWWSRELSLTATIQSHWVVQRAATTTQHTPWCLACTHAHAHMARAHTHTPARMQQVPTHTPLVRCSTGQRSCTKDFMGDCGTVQPRSVRGCLRASVGSTHTSCCVCDA
jgi:hypothetical protein